MRKHEPSAQRGQVLGETRGTRLPVEVRLVVVWSIIVKLPLAVLDVDSFTFLNSLPTVVTL
ncbi:hypothetical protein NEOLEDRAFT_1129096 [Neolentinus lepideus HHB14362 ss-1]|uniref:Uncharacterized protein n=1 Tax=Neolentinus lepideus HHB14362 ss-1 TaxID=1314782 RepID=A0A165UXE0_9AGAM|nr:hypothetical protein NEOLEDRAFT_1129096 [Neolentinus lepideus HHB14362 ss-1]